MTRSDYHDKMQRLLAEWEVRTGRKVDQIAIPAKLRDITHWLLNRDELPPKARTNAMWNKLLGLTDWYISEGHTDTFVPLNIFRKCIVDSLNDSPMPTWDSSIPDYPDQPVPSAARKKLAPPGKRLSGHYTRPSLTRQIQRSPKCLTKLIADALAIEPMLPKPFNTQEVFNVLMQEQFLAKRMPLWEPSDSYIPGQPFRSLAKPPVPLWTHLTDDNKVKFAELYACQGFEECHCNRWGDSSLRR